VRFDHVILAAADLDESARRIGEELGLDVLPGGSHAALGTHNRVVPLGGGYLELMAVRDPERAADSELVAALHARLAAAQGHLMAWCLAVDDVEAVAQRLGTPVTQVSREGLSARVTGLAEALAEPCLPFFITRDEGIEDPGVGGDAGGITWIEVSGESARLDDWLAGSELPVRVVAGDQGIRAMGIGGREFRP
jgi:hypothetical protein